MLCSVETWNRKDGNFDLLSFYENIVALFEKKPDHPWVIDTLTWWDK
jgi:hypothetical protein